MTSNLDSHKSTWEHVVRLYANIIYILYKQLEYIQIVAIYIVR